MKCTIIIRERDLPTSTASRAWSVDGLPPYFVIHPKPFYYTPSSALPLGLRLYRNLRLIQLEHRGARAPDPKAEGRSLQWQCPGCCVAAEPEAAPSFFWQLLLLCFDTVGILVASTCDLPRARRVAGVFERREVQVKPDDVVLQIDAWRVSGLHQMQQDRAQAGAWTMDTRDHGHDGGRKRTIYVPPAHAESRRGRGRGSGWRRREDGRRPQAPTSNLDAPQQARSGLRGTT